MAAPVVRELWRYPVKSMRGERLRAARLDARGFEGDRALAVLDRDGKIGSGKITRRFRPIPGLRAHSARTDDGVVVRLPSGEERRADDPAIDAVLSASLGQPVRLAAEAGVPHFDAAGVHLLSAASLAWVSARSGAALSAFAFRPNILVESATPWPAEEAWVGRTLAIGAVRLRVVERTERCVMVNARPDGGADERVLRALASANASCLGVYAEVLVPGAIREGDAVTVG